MAINAQKFLPPSKVGSLVKINTNLLKKSSSNVFSEQSQNNIGIVSIKLIEIDDILKGTIASEKKKLNDSKKSDSNKRRSKFEEKLETKPKVEGNKLQLPSIPGMSFLDKIKNFIGNVILGYFAVRLLKHLPKLIPILNVIGKATDFILNFGGKLLDGLVTFIDWGYKAYDSTRGFTKNLFGEDGVKKFDQLSGLLNNFLNLAIIAGMAAAGSGGFGGKGPNSKPGLNRPRVTSSNDIRNPLRQRPNVTTGRGGSRQFRLPGAGARVTTSAAGKRGLLYSVRPFLKRIPVPVIGALIDFGLSVALGENPGRAAFRAIGAGLLGYIGAGLAGALGLVGGPLAIATSALGAIAGGAMGDLAGGALYDVFFGGKPPKSSTRKMAGGGITRGGKKSTAIRRTIGKGKKRGKYKRVALKKPGKVEVTSPGADVGGEDKLFGLFPNPFKFMQQKASEVANPFNVIKKAGKNLGESDYFGPILSITSKILLGQKPSQEDYKNVGLGINMLIGKGIDDGKLKGGVVSAFAEGGFVDPKTLNAISQGGDISDWVAKSFKEATETNSQKTLREIQENLRLKPTGTKRSDTSVSPDEPINSESDGGYSTNSGDYKELLDLISKHESAGAGYNAYNEGGAAGGYRVIGYGGDSRKGPLKRALTDMTIKEIMAHQKNVNPPIHAAGRYQIIGSTLKSLMNGGYGPTGVRIDDKFTPDIQDKLGIALIKYRLKTGANPTNFISEWRGLKFADQEKLQSAINKAQRGRTFRVDVPGSVIGSASQKGLPPLPPTNTIKGQNYGDSRDGGRRRHAGQDYDAPLDGTFYSRIGGEVIYSGNVGGGYGNVIDIYNKRLGVTERIAEGTRNLVRLGQKVTAGTPVQQGTHQTGVFHYEIRKGKATRSGSFEGTIDPKRFLSGSSSYEKGGMTKDYPHMALIGEKGREFVIDADSTDAIEKTFPGFLGALNNAKYKQAINVLRNFASYESESSEIVVIPMPIYDYVQDDENDYPTTSSLPTYMGQDSDAFEILYQGL